MLTGHASMEIAIRGMELGAFDYSDEARGV